MGGENIIPKLAAKFIIRDGEWKWSPFFFLLETFWQPALAVAWDDGWYVFKEHQRDRSLLHMCNWRVRNYSTYHDCRWFQIHSERNLNDQFSSKAWWVELKDISSDQWSISKTTGVNLRLAVTSTFRWII